MACGTYSSTSGQDDPAREFFNFIPDRIELFIDRHLAQLTDGDGNTMLLNDVK